MAAGFLLKNNLTNLLNKSDIEAFSRCFKAYIFFFSIYYVYLFIFDISISMFSTLDKNNLKWIYALSWSLNVQVFQ